MIRQIKTSKKDFEMIDQSCVLGNLKHDDSSNYEGLVVKKPWGFEYLLFHNNHVAGWTLHINKGNQTSLHCHPHKKTSLIVLKGQGILRTSQNAYDIKDGECSIIDKGVFHSTKALSDMIVLEIESPPNKKDLYRFDDMYGRSSSPYEGTGSYINLNEHKDYADLPTLYNFKKNLGFEIEIGNYSISIHEHKKIKEMDENNFDLQNIMIGMLGSADMIYGHNYKKLAEENVDINNEIILIIKK